MQEIENNLKLQKLDKFLVERSRGKYSLADALFLVQVGSHTIGTAGKTSDYDYRMVLRPTEGSIYGLDMYNHGKYVSGEHGFNNFGDLDLEMLSFDMFMQKLFDGDILILEMLYAPESAILIKDNYIQPILANREAYLHEGVARNYLKYAYGLMKKVIHQQEENANHGIVKKSFEAYGYDTKKGMKALLYFRTAKEILETKTLRIERPDAPELLEIRKGKYNRREMIKVLEDLNDSLTYALKLKGKPAILYQQHNKLCIDITKALLGVK